MLFQNFYIIPAKIIVRAEGSHMQFSCKFKSESDAEVEKQFDFILVIGFTV